MSHRLQGRRVAGISQLRVGVLKVVVQNRYPDFSTRFPWRAAKAVLGSLSLWVAMTAAPFSARAEEATFRLAVGGYLVDRYDTSFSLTSRSAGVGLAIDPREALDTESDRTVLRLEGMYRFNPRHKLVFSWYSVSSDGYKVLEEQLDWVDASGNEITIPVGASVATALDYEIYRIGYAWSFYRTDKVELSAGAGAHVTHVGVNLDADTTSSGVSADKVDTTLPLPVFTLGMNYNVTPRFQWYFENEAFAMSVGKWEGVYTDTRLGAEYLLWGHLGVGLGLSSTNLRVKKTGDDKRLKFENRITGLMFYLSGTF